MSHYQNTCCALIKQLNDSLEKYSNNRLRQDGLTIMQISVLVELDETTEKELPLKDLERRFGVAQPTMLGIVRRMEQKGLTETYFSQEDKRVKLVRLTSAGKEKCRFGYAYMDQAEQLLLKALDDQEKQQFRQLLKKAKSSLQ